MISKRKHRHFAGYVFEWLVETITGFLSGIFGALFLWIGGCVIIYVAGFVGIPLKFAVLDDSVADSPGSSFGVLLLMVLVFGFVGLIVGSNHGILKNFQLSKPMYLVVGFALGAFQGGILLCAGLSIPVVIFGAIFGGVFGAFADKIMKQCDIRHKNQIKT